MLRLAARIGAPLVLMDHGKDPIGLHAPHDDKNAGTTPDDGQQPAVVNAVANTLQQMRSEAFSAGVLPWQLILDPGLGFAKNETQSVELVRWLPSMKKALGDTPMLLGPSRKRMTAAAVWTRDGEQSPAPFEDRDWYATRWNRLLMITCACIE
eukprot:SAG31_NODE_7491_length_1675_cov_1.236041_1_plen_153_part_00